MLIPLAAAFAQSPIIQGQIEQLDRELCGQGSRLLHVNTDVNGDSEYYAVSPERLAATPEWDGNGSPPLDLSKALDNARKHLEFQHPEHSSYSFIQGRIFSVDHHSYSNRWCYQLDFRVETKASKEIDRAILGAITINDQPINVPDRVPVETTRYKDMPVFVMVDGSIVEAKQMVGK